MQNERNDEMPRASAAASGAGPDGNPGDSGRLPLLENSHPLAIRVIPSLTLTAFISMIFVGHRVLVHYYFYEMHKMS